MRGPLIALLAIVLIHCAPPTQRGRAVAEATTTQEPVSEPAAAEQTPESAPRTSQEPSEPTRPAPNTLAWKDVDLWMYNEGPTDGQLRDPTFWIHAERGQRAETGKIWSLQEIRAVIYRENDENLIVEAADGQFDEDKGMARLTRRVRLTTGPLMVDLEELLWDNTKGLATSDRPVGVTDGETKLAASRMLINPDEDTIVLDDGGGLILLLETNP